MSAILAACPGHRGPSAKIWPLASLRCAHFGKWHYRRRHRHGRLGFARSPRSSLRTISIQASTRSCPRPPGSVTEPPANVRALTIRSPYGGGIFGGQTHSQSPEALFAHVAGLKTVIPSNPMTPRAFSSRRWKTMIRSSFSSRKNLYGPFDGFFDRPVTPWAKHPAAEVPDGHYTVPIGKAAMRARARN